MRYHFVVCMKQVPMVSELPWDSRSGRLRRDLADGMMNPACKHALEAAIQLKDRHGARITVLTMGPVMAEEILREALAMGADSGILLTDPKMAGADTMVTSFTLARAITRECPDFDLVLCGCHTSDSETAQVGPQLAEELNVAGVAYVEKLDLQHHTVRLEREADDFLETIEMDLPGVVTIATQRYTPRYASLGGLQEAFDRDSITVIDAQGLGLTPEQIGRNASPTRILDVYSPAAQKENIVMRGSAKKVVEDLLDQFGDQIAAAIGKDLKPNG
ncbi:Electron transfer flavoprotein, beta subunit [Olavius algarvensis associated proteobacterium Delta 3]|nr:Electron transfer flavoprotein, beta subunit [Olavius algarvensis associated proteobacterium Delta 3]